MEMIKNIDHEKALVLKDLVTCQPGQIVSKTLSQNDAVSITLFAFGKGEEISTHSSHGDALVYCLEGKGRITIDDKETVIKNEECIIMPAEHPHAVYAEDDFKMLLIVVF